MMTLTARSYQGEHDLQPIVDLINTCIQFDHEDGYRTVADLENAFTEPDCNPAEDIRLWEDSNHQLVGYSNLWIPDENELEPDTVGHLGLRIRPRTRNQGLEQDMLIWARARTLATAQMRDNAAKLRVHCRDNRQDRIDLFTRAGFRLERTFFRMGRSLLDAIPDVALPTGFRLIEGEQIDTADWVEMHNQTFIDHWNFHPLTVEQIEHYLLDPDYRPELNLVAVAPDGTYAAFCYAHIHAEENHVYQRQRGWINMLGTRRGYRRMGLGRTLLCLGLQRLKAASMNEALLGVDAENPNQAYHLYESLGFRRQFATLGYVKRLN